MKPMVLVYVSNVSRSLPFYEALGFRRRTLHRRGGWAELSFGDTILALHETHDLPPPERSRVQLCFEASEPLEELLEGFGRAGLTPHQEITDENYGRILQFQDPDGYIIQINEHDKTLYA